MQIGETFHDPGLKTALAREAERTAVDPKLRASVEALFAQSGNASHAETRSIPMFHRRNWLLAAAAVVVAGLGIAFFTLRNHDEEEYLIAEARLWPAMAGLYRPGATTGPVVLNNGPTLPDSRYTLLAVRNDKIETVPCQVADYRREDGSTFSLITTPAANLVREPDEEADERYDERVGAIRIVGGIKDDYWVCVAAPATAPEEFFKQVLDQVTSPAREHPAAK